MRASTVYGSANQDENIDAGGMSSHLYNKRKGGPAATGSISGNQLNAGQCVTGTAMVSGARTSMTASVSPSTNPLPDANHGLAIWAFVSGNDTVTVEVCAVVSQTTLTSTSYNVRVSK